MSTEIKSTAQTAGKEMSMGKLKWFVSRQLYWGVEPEDRYCVEIAQGGNNYANPDMLVPKYPGEGEEYTDPTKAVEAALAIAESWHRDNPGIAIINVAHGNTGGDTMPFEGEEREQLIAWAKKVSETLPTCDQCGCIMGDESWFPTADPDLGKYCSEVCCERAIEYYASHNEEVLAPGKARDAPPFTK
jgi:hypothetical protein